MTGHEQTMQSSGFRDQKTGLVVFGILQVILGGICALMVPLMIIGIIASAVFEDGPAMPMNTSMIILGALFYALLAVWFICMGIGSIRTRRWARALVLVSSWLWLICGISGLVFFLLFMPNMYDQMAKSGQMPRQMVSVMKYMMAAFMTVIYVIIPGALVLFYRSKHVKATCESRDPRIRWTDKCPLPVLAVSLIFGFWAFSMLSMGFYGWTIPFFGFILSGMAGAVVVLVSACLSGYAAWGVYKLSIKAWWCSVLLVAAWGLSMGITFSRVSMWDFYEKMNFPEQQLDMMKQIGVPQGSAMVLWVGLSFVGLLGYLGYTRRCFVHSSVQESSS